MYIICILYVYYMYVMYVMYIAPAILNQTDLAKMGQMCRIFFFRGRFYPAGLPISQYNASKSVSICLKDFRKAYFAYFGPTRPILYLTTFGLYRFSGGSSGVNFWPKIAKNRKNRRFSRKFAKPPRFYPQKVWGPRTGRKGPFWALGVQNVYLHPLITPTLLGRCLAI